MSVRQMRMSMFNGLQKDFLADNEETSFLIGLCMEGVAVVLQIFVRELLTKLCR
jgi:hypothetical protein